MADNFQRVSTRASYQRRYARRATPRRAVGGAIALVRAGWIPSGVLISVYLVMTVLNTLSMAQQTDVDVEEHLLVRSFGDPAGALERIREENFTTSQHLNELAGDPDLSPEQRAVYRHAPLLLAPREATPVADDVFIGVYYTLNSSVFEGTRSLTISYWFFATDESGGTIIPRRLALFGHPIDRELIYRVRLLDDDLIGAHYQAPGHRLVRFQYDGSYHPIFAVASLNHNFRPVWPEELKVARDMDVLVPLPRDELAHDPAHDPDFVALAAREALEQYALNLSHYVYVEFQNPYHDGRATVSAKVRGRWYHLHESIAGLTRPGYNQVGIPIGFTPEPEDIEEVRITGRSPRDVEVDVISVYIYPRLQLIA